MIDAMCCVVVVLGSLFGPACLSRVDGAQLIGATLAFCCTGIVCTNCI